MTVFMDVASRDSSSPEALQTNHAPEKCLQKSGNLINHRGISETFPSEF